MENIGYQKKKDRNTTKGFTYFDKEEALEGVRKARDIELAIRADTKDEVEYYKRIFPEFRAGEFFATQFFEIKIYKHFTRKFKLKDAYIEFTPFYNPKELKYQLNDRNKKVFEIPNNQIEAKVLALYFLNTLAVNRKNKMEAYSFKVEKLLQIAGIKSDRKYESRVRKKLANSLRYLKNEGIIEDYTLPPRNKGWNSYEKFLSSEVKIEFFN